MKGALLERAVVGGEEWVFTPNERALIAEGNASLVVALRLPDAILPWRKMEIATVLSEEFANDKAAEGSVNRMWLRAIDLAAGGMDEPSG